MIRSTCFSGRKVLTSGLARVAFLLLMALAAPAQAHPNIVLDYRLVFDFDGTDVTDIGESWSFDAAFSEELLSDFDTDRDGTFNAEETRAMGDEILGNLSEVRYLTYIFVDGHDLGKLEPFGFRTQVRDGVVTLAFGNHLPAPVDASRSRIAVQIKDPDFMIMALPAEKQPVFFRGVPKGRCSTEIGDKPQDAYYGGLIVPQEVSVTCK